MVLFLIGYMGCGKSTVGRRVSSRLGCQFVDMDSAIEQAAGMSVAEIFAQHGEPEFRRMEREWLAGFDANDNVVVATGGGAPCQGDNMEVMNSRGLTCYLKMTPAKLVLRLSESGRQKRPLIRGMNDEQLLEFIAKNLEIRDACYSQARLVIDCDGVSDEYVCNHIERYVGNSRS